MVLILPLQALLILHKHIARLSPQAFFGHPAASNFGHFTSFPPAKLAGAD